MFKIATRTTLVVATSALLAVGFVAKPTGPTASVADTVSDTITLISNPTSGLPPCC